MPVHITWYDTRQTIMLYVFSGRWSVTELFNAMDDWLTTHPESISTLFFIVDLRESQTVPSGILAERERLFQLFVQPGELTVLVGANRFAQIVMGMIQRLGLLGEVAFADSIEAAEILIRQHPCYQDFVR
jgi:hypothetical protein